MTKYRLKAIRLLKNSLGVSPMAILDGKEVAAASGFLSDFVEDKEDVTIDAIAPDYIEAPLQTLEIDGKDYLVYSKALPAEIIGKPMTAVTFIPLEHGIGNSGVFGNIAVMLIFADNYDEVMETVEEIRRPVLSALVERKLSVMARQISAIIRRFEKDKYLIVLTTDKLELIRGRKFDILTAIREIDVGNKAPMTLSIGVGVNGVNLAQNMDFARAALDLALGRGGDQALIKDRDRFLFFGGDTPETPRNDGVIARVKLYAFNELLAESSNVIIMGHRRMDMDCLGAAVGVYKIAGKKVRDCYILMEESNQGLLCVYEKLTENGAFDGVMINEEKALDIINEGSLLVIVDVNRPSIVQSQRLLEAASRLVVIDHHRLAADYIEGSVLTYHAPSASSTCELVCQMMQHGSGIKLSPAEADIMLAGITVDTKNFTQKTGIKTFEAAAYLKRNSADGTRVRMYLQDDFRDMTAMAAAVAGAELRDDLAFAICKNALNPVQAAAKAADELIGVTGVNASFVFCKLKDEDAVYISARSLGKVNVQSIMERLGGGGHQTMAAAAVYVSDIKKAKQALEMVLNEKGCENEGNSN